MALRSNTLNIAWSLCRMKRNRLVGILQDNNVFVLGINISNVHGYQFGTASGASATIDVGDRFLTIKTGELARFADGSAVAEFGNTAVLVTAVSKSKLSSTAGFLPLTVDYRQKAAAAGRIPTNFLRRELGPSEKEILTSRMIDRSIRPLFPPGYHFDTQLMCNLLSVDGINNPDILSINAASAALCLSDIPWHGPVGAVRVGLVDQEVMINPTRRQLQHSQLDLVVTGCSGSHVVMMEGSGDVVTEDNLKKCVKAGIKATQTIVSCLQQLQETHGKVKRTFEPVVYVDEAIMVKIHQLAGEQIKSIFCDNSHDKISRDQAIANLKLEVIKTIQVEQIAERNSERQATLPDVIICSSDGEMTELDDITNVTDQPIPVTRAVIAQSYDKVVKDIFRDLILDGNRRCDGRNLSDLRDITCSVDLYQSLHGSALFQRGQTQVLSTVTFDSPDSSAKLDSISAITSGIKDKNFMLHYEFPPYATNELSRPGVIGRRELGHGALAEKGLRSVIPNDFPFTIRLTCEVLESNGSSSMASVCGGSLALMDAGVKISKPVAGVAVGLVTGKHPDTNKIDKYKILTDISGIEDYMGDMDFKMAGTRSGMTSLQLDVKLAGIPLSIVMDAIYESWQARGKILNIMHGTLSAARLKAKDNSPVIEKLEVPPAKRSRFVGLGGFNLKKLRADTGVSLTPIDETTYQLFAPNTDALTEAKEVIESLLQEEKAPELEFGGVYTTKVVEIKEYGVMVEIHPLIPPVLLHNSQLDQRKISHPSALGLEVGSEITAKYFGRDPANGQIRLSRKVLFSPASNVIKSLNKDRTT